MKNPFKVTQICHFNHIKRRFVQMILNPQVPRKIVMISFTPCLTGLTVIYHVGAPGIRQGQEETLGDLSRWEWVFRVSVGCYVLKVVI